MPVDLFFTRDSAHCFEQYRESSLPVEHGVQTYQILFGSVNRAPRLTDPSVPLVRHILRLFSHRQMVFPILGQRFVERSMQLSRGKFQREPPSNRPFLQLNTSQPHPTLSVGQRTASSRSAEQSTT